MSGFHSLLPLRNACMAMALAVPLATATGASADIIKRDDMLRGITLTRVQCGALTQAVWVTVDGRDFCVRYYLSTAGGEGRRPVVFLQGDKFGKLDSKTWSWSDFGETKDVDTEDLVRAADSFSKMAKTTAIYLARIGVDGTSGNHTARKTVLELNLMNAALEAIKQRHRFEGFHLAGQSGGSKLIAGLIRMRNDIGCVVPGSGPLQALQNNKPLPDLGRTYFDPQDAIAVLAQKRALRIIVVTDPNDKIVPAKNQSAYVSKMRQVGGRIEQILVDSTDEEHHGVVEFARLVVAGCVLNRSNEEIARAVNTLIKRNAEWNAVRAAETKAATASGVATRQPAIDPRPAPGSPSQRKPSGA